MGKNPLYDHLGVNYDATRHADPHIAHRLAYHLITQRPGNYLDIACGSGNYTIALDASRINLHGIDQSIRMIEQAHQKNTSVNWYVGDGEDLPFADASFTGALCTLAIHHFRDIPATFREIFRVLAGGRFVLFTSTPEQMSGYWLNEYFPVALARSRAQMPTFEEVSESLRRAGFRNIGSEIYEVTGDLKDLFLYSGKHRPDFYLSPKVRAGISTFANLIDQDELDLGCGKIASDLKSGRIVEVAESYRHDRGDYLFVVAEKSDAI
jgi:ubiquinone/menaquinone biosynthesis C-methylase UbiE